MISVNQKNKLFSMKLIKVTALTVSCMASLPSFAQSPCPIGTTNCTLPNNTANPPDNNTPYWWGAVGGSSIANNPHPWSNQCSGIGCDSSDDDSGGYDSTGSVCVSQQELTNNIQVCVAATLGATGGAIAVLNGTACSTCFVVPNIISCGTCAALTAFTGLAVNLAASQCQPPEMTVCPN